METELIRLVKCFGDKEEFGSSVKESLSFLKKYGPKERQAHRRLCSSMLAQADGGNGDIRSLLHYAGAEEVFCVVYSNIAHTKLATARWLCTELHSLLQSAGVVCSVLTSQAKSLASATSEVKMTTQLSLQQQQLVSFICRLPDVLANRLGRQLRESLFPGPYFRTVGDCFRDSLDGVYRHLEGGGAKAGLEFHGALLGQAATLGYHSAILETVLPYLERRVMEDPVWSRLSQSLFLAVPASSLEPVLEALVNYTSPSIQPASPLAALVGRDILARPKARLVLTHKLVLVRVPSSGSSAIFNLLGYLAGCQAGRELLGKSLQSALEVWSDATSVRHMDTRQHLWLSRILALGVKLMDGQKEWLDRRTGFLKVLLTGIQVHIESPLPEVRHVGMAVGQCLMNLLHPTNKESNGLNFDYKPSPDTDSIEELVRPLDEQERKLRASWTTAASSSDGGGCGLLNDKVVEGGVRGGAIAARGNSCSSSSFDAPPSQSPQRDFGEGLVRAVDCSDSDSDDDLEPYAMDDDPDASDQAPPRYLRTLMQDLLSTREPVKVEVALQAAEKLVRSKPSDLREVCVELSKILLHLSDDYSLEDFGHCRHSAMVALASLCPDLVIPYLTREFYAPNYTLRHRMDVLEAISAAALELSSPSSSSTPSAPPHPPSAPWSSRKPWEDIINQRLKAKTKIISKGPRQPSLQPVANRFADVALLFFFPLMNQFDRPMNTLDLLGQDALVLGNLLYTLGTVMYAAANLPVVVAMASAFLDFLWALRYHRDAYVRQGVLYGMGMLLWATPHHMLLEELSVGVAEAVSWMKEVEQNDPDQKSRTLAGNALGMIKAIK